MSIPVQPGSDGHENRGAMPTPSSAGAPSDTPAGAQMPAPSMGSAARGEMPRPDSARAADASGAGAMSMAGGSDGVPAELPRFAGPHGGPAAFEPGVVEVQFRDDVAPALTTDGPVPSVATAAGETLDAMNELLRRHGLRQAEPTILISQADATAAQALVRDQGMQAPHLAAFLTLHFAEDADTPRIAAELSSLPEVERAVAVPTALPPTLVAEPATAGTGTAPGTELPRLVPPGEPLTGHSGQVVVDTTTGLENQWYVFRCGIDQAWTRASGRDVVIGDVD